MHADIQGRKRIQAVTATTSHTSTGKTATGREGGQTEVRPITQRIAEEIGVGEGQVRVAVDLLDGGATVPFIARYRKEATGALDDTQLRALEERLRYLRELDERRAAILESIESQGKLTDELRARIVAADSKARLEDIYLPYKPKRRTKAQIAREAGLEPLADLLLDDPSHDPQTAAAGYVDADKGVADAAAALEGARAILVERFAEDADLIGALRERMWNQGRIVSRVREGKEESGAKFSDYFDFAEPFAKLPSHRVLALFRGEKEEVLDLDLEPEEAPEEPGARSSYEVEIARRFGVVDQGRPADKWLSDTVRWAWRTRILVHLGIDMRTRLRQEAEDEAVRVFAANLRDLLLAAPAGSRATMGLDPGLRTGVKVAVVDPTGKVVATDTIYPHEPRRRWDESIATLARLAREHAVELVSIGNGTASRETDKLVADLIARHPELKLTKVDGVGGRRVGVLGVRVRRAGAARPGRLAARRGVDRPPPPGPARRARQDRPEVDRRRPVPARRVRGEAVPLARRRRRGLRERRRRRRQHRLRAAADPRVGHRRGAGGEHRRPPRRPRPVPDPRGRSGPSRGSARRRSSSARASCASPAATTRSTRPACTRRRTRSCAASWTRPAATSRPHRQHGRCCAP